MSLSGDDHDGLTMRAPPLDPSTVLPPQRICDRVSGPIPGDGFPCRGTGMTEGGDWRPPRFLAEPRNDRTNEGIGGMGVVSLSGDDHDGLTMRGRPPLDP